MKIESEIPLPHLLQNTPQGSSFVTTRLDRFVTSYCFRYGMKVKTVQGHMVFSGDVIMVPIVVVTVVDPYNKKNHKTKSEELKLAKK